MTTSTRSLADQASEEHSSDCDCDECLDADPDFTDCEESTDSEEYETGEESGCDHTDSELDYEDYKCI